MLVERGLAASRTQAQALVMAGRVPGHSKPGEQVDENVATGKWQLTAEDMQALAAIA